MKPTPIQHVSDTASWVATFRARESERPDALFHDPLARRLIGDEGERIAGQMKNSAVVGWSVVMRTCLIDDYLRQAFAGGINAVLNLGAGLDTRPYRMDLPPGLLWIEVDYPRIVELKEERLKSEKPRCNLERVSLDLADREKRRQLFSELNRREKKVLVLTEGVVPYLSNESVEQLAEDLHAQASFEFWIVDYWSRFFRDRLGRSKTSRQLQNAPFLFDPPKWTEFFGSLGWEVAETRYIGTEAMRVGRPAPVPFWLKFMGMFLSAEKKKSLARMSGYALLRARRPSVPNDPS